MILRWSCAVGLLAAVTALAARPVDDPAPVAGNWIVAYSSFSPTSESRLALVKIETADGKAAVSVVHTGPAPKDGKAREFKVSGASVKGGKVAFTLDSGGLPATFEGAVDPKNAKQIAGTLTIDGKTVYRAKLLATDKTELAAADMFASAGKAPPQIIEISKLNSAAFPLRKKASETKDLDERRKLLDEAKDATKKANDAMPDLYREVLKTAPESPHAVVAAEYLVGKAEAIKAKPEEVAAWLKVIDAEAAQYGPKFSTTTTLRVGELLAVQSGYEAVSVNLLERGLADKSVPPLRRASGYGLLAACLDTLGKDKEAAAVRVELAKLDGELDADYRKTVPPFKVAKYAGRTDKAANRVAVLELFTGAQCPPCVAADVAFDAAIKAYAPTDVVLLQYHLHIPRPDPLTGPEAVARMDYYRKVFPETVSNATPTVLFNGKPGTGSARGGGSMQGSAQKFETYKKIIDETLEQTTDVKLSGSSREAGNVVTATVDVAGLKDTKNVKLRLVLVEDDVKYVGSNGVRFHHHVVRSLFGKPEGVPVADLKGGHYEAKLKLDDVKAGLDAYLTKYQTDNGRFPRNDKPLALKGLKVYALVQNDDTGELLQAAELTPAPAAAGS